MNNLKSYTEYAVSTPTTDFVIGFDFIYGTDAVNVAVDDVPATAAGYSVIYLNSTTIRLSPAVPSGVVRLQRETDIDVPDNQFTAGAKFIASNMDENFTQIRHSQQEVRDGFSKLTVDQEQKFEDFKDSISYTELRNTVQEVHDLKDQTESYAEVAETNYENSQALLGDIEMFAADAEQAKVQAVSAASEAYQYIDEARTYVDTTVTNQTATVNAALVNQTNTVNTALSNLSTEANKFYPTLADANADIANITVNQPVQVGEAGVSGGLYYKATAEATTLTKSPQDPLTQAKNYTDSFASVKTQDISNISINTIQTLGSYRVTNADLPTVTDLPFNAACDIEVHGNTVSLWQEVKQNNSNNFAIRSSNGGSTVGWNPWIYPAFKNEIPSINVFPNPSLTSAKAVTYQASVIQESGLDVLQMTGSTTQQAIYEVDAVDDFAVGNTLTLSADSFADVAGNGVSADITIIVLNSAGTILAQQQANISTASTYQKLTSSLLIPTNTVKVRFRFVKRAQASIAKFKSVVLTTSAEASINKYNIDANASATIYMSLTGNDSNDGSFANPVLTFVRAVAAAGKNGKIIMRGGDYINATSASGFNIAGVESIHITSYKNEKVRVIQGIRLSSITKTSGYTKVYQAPLTATNPERYLWLHDVPDVSTLIDIADRHPLQRGETYRLPHTKLWKVASIALVESSTRPSFYFDSTAKIAYFSVPSGTDVLTATIYAPSNYSGLIYGGTGVEEVEVSGNITMMYGGLRNVDARNLKRFKHTNLFAFGGKGQGIVLDDTFVSEGNWARCAGNNDDGYNGHVYNVNTQCVHKCENLWTHDNGDDGESMHEYTDATYTNILSEFNGDRGAAPAYGAHCTYIGYVFQNNGQETVKDGGEGIGVVGASSEGVGTQAILFGGVSRGNVINYRTGAADASMKIVNGHSFDATDCGFDANTGRIEIINTGDSGSTVVKRGNVVVKNTTQVT